LGEADDHRVPPTEDFVYRRQVVLAGLCVAQMNAGGVGTLLAAVGAELWVALTTALATTLTTWLVSRQLEETLVRYNQSAADLANVRDWWTKLSPAAKRNPKNIEQLVEVTEQVLETELSGWVQRMENALAQLKAAEEKGEKSEGGKKVENFQTRDRAAFEHGIVVERHRCSPATSRFGTRPR
jgi:Tfp pilus assembly protein PilV